MVAVVRPAPVRFTGAAPSRVLRVALGTARDPSLGWALADVEAADAAGWAAAAAAGWAAA